MPTEIVMPQMSYDMREGKVMRWLKNAGEEVTRGEPIVEIETDKTVVEVQAYGSGLLRRILVEEGQTATVGQVIAYVGAADDPLPDVDPAGEAEPPAQVERKHKVQPERRERVAPTVAHGVRASPLAKRLARQKGIDLVQVHGTGPGGRITREDVETFEAPASESPATAEDEASSRPHIVRLSRMRQAVARITTESKSTAPHFYVTSAIDMTRAMASRQKMNQDIAQDSESPSPISDLPSSISVTDIIIKACAEALVMFPNFNATFKQDHLEVHPHVNIGIAINVDDGLIVAAIPDCDHKPLPQIARDREDLVQRARQGKLRESELVAGTFSISNLGMFDVDEFSAIIYRPQAAVLAAASVRKQAVVLDDEIVIRQMMKATLSVDHRVADGAEAAQFLSEAKRVLENISLPF